MNVYSAIADVSDTLIRLMNDNKIIKSNEVDLSSPENISSDKKLSLFLYQITENTYLKNQNMQAIDTNKYKKPPLSLSLFYLITPTLKTGADYVKNNQIILTRILQMIHDNPIIRDPHLWGSLAGNELRLILNSMSLDELNKLWSILNTKSFKLSISLEVSPVLIESSKEQEVIRVKQRDLEYMLKKEEERDE